MRFHLVDRIVEVKRGERIRIVKNLSLGEEYLADHFPTFPVMPGVLMLQTLVEAGSWLLRITEDFRHSVVVLREAKNVKYGSFMEPGKNLVITVEAIDYSEDAPEVVLKGKGEADGVTTVSARFTLRRYNLADRNPALKARDQKLIDHLRETYGLLRGDLDGWRQGEPRMAHPGPGE